jgi:hypothetical protein
VNFLGKKQAFTKFCQDTDLAIALLRLQIVQLNKQRGQ